MKLKRESIDMRMVFDLSYQQPFLGNNVRVFMMVDKKQLSFSN